MMKVRMRRIAGLITAILLLSTTLAGVWETNVWADEIDDGREVCDDMPGTDDGEQTLGDPIVGDGYHLEPGSHNVSLGTLTQGSDPGYTAISIRNMSTRAVQLIWMESDPYNVLMVDAPQDPYLEVGRTSDYWVKPNTNASPGIYKITMVFGDSSDPSYTKGTKVDISFTLVAAEPYVDRVTLNPGDVEVSPGANIQYVANVTGGNNPSTAVNWSVNGQSSSGTRIDSNGFLTIDRSETSKSLTVTATSVQTPSVSGSSRVSIVQTDYTVTVTADPAEGGNVNGGGTVSAGGSVTVLAAPNISYQFAGWYQNGNKITDQPKYTASNIRENITLVAKFVKKDCYVTVKRNNDSAGEVTSSQFVQNGGSLTLQASAKKGWQFEYWQEDGKKISGDVKFNLTGITKDRVIIAVFSQTQYDVSLGVNPKDCGSVKGGGSFAKGSKPKVKAEAYNGYVFKNWTLNGKEVSTNPELVIDNISQDYYLVANFEKKNVTNYTISAAVCSNDGMISPAGKSTVQQGGSLLYTITPKKGFRVLAVAVDNVQVGPVTTYTFTNVGANHSIVAAFAPIENPQPVKPAEEKKPAKKATEADFEKTADANRPASKKDKTSVEKTDTLTPDDTDEFFNQTVVNDEATQGMVTEDYIDRDAETGLYQEFNLTQDEIKELRDSNSEDLREIGMRAIYDGYLQVAIYDDFDNNVGVTGGNFVTNPYLPNATEVVASIMNEDDIHNIMAGNPVKVNINIYDSTEFVDPIDKADIDEHLPKNMNVGRYFEVIMMKNSDNNTETITETPVGLKLCMTVPEDMRKDGRDFYVLRKHINADGTYLVSILPDEDKDDSTITITTDKFSAYAMAYEDSKGGSGKTIVIILVAVVAVLALVLAIVVGRSASAARRRRRRHKSNRK